MIQPTVIPYAKPNIILFIFGSFFENRTGFFELSRRYVVGSEINPSPKAKRLFLI